MMRNKKDAYSAALAVLEKLRAAGHVALFAGGCVRDRILGCEPKDYDIATDAHPDRVVEVFPRARTVGAAFGVVLVRHHGCDIEVATFRSDGRYADGRHPESVTFGTEVEDARRRDFTINGLFYDPIADKTIDHVGGLADLSSRTLRAIGMPHERFGEDHLRMLRAVRFAARLDFRIEPETFSAIKSLAASLCRISAERVWIELEQIILSPTRRHGWALLTETGLHHCLTPRWQPTVVQSESIGARLAALPAMTPNAALPLAALLCDETVAAAAEIGKALRLSNRLIKSLEWLVGVLPTLRSGPDDLADLKLLMARQDWPAALELLRIDLASTDESLHVHQRLCERASAVPEDSIAPPPLLDGHELLDLGVDPGPSLGDMLRAVYRAQLNEKIRTKQEACAMVRRRLEAELG